MQVQVTNKPEASQAELAVSVLTEDFQIHVKRAAEHLSKTTPLKGFRPGKAPVKAVLEAFGQERLLNEAVELALPRLFVRAAVEHDVEAINRPAIAIKKLGLNEPFEFTATVDVLPQVKLGDFKKVQVERKPVSVEDAEVEREIAALAKMRAKPLEVSRAAEKGDTAVIDFAVKIDDKVIEGGESKNHPVPIGEGHFVPGFEDNLVGVKAGEERAFEIMFPADYPKKDVAGKKAQVNVKAHRVEKHVLPAIEDAFVKSLGKFENVADFKAKLLENIKTEKAAKEKERLAGEMMEKLAAAATFGPIPPVLVDREIDSRLHELSHMLAWQQQTLEQYLARRNKTLAQIRDEMKEAAEKAVKVGLAMRAFATQEKIEVADEEIEAQLNAYLAQQSPKAAPSKHDLDHVREEITVRLRNLKALDKLEELTGGRK